MKKILAVIVTICIALCTFTACSSAKNTNKNEKESTETSSGSYEVITTDNAKIAESNAINLIKEQYTAKELGLSQDDYENGSFMVASSGVEYDGNYYVKVINAIKQEHTDEEGNLSYTFDTKGEYLISYDGNTILRKDMKADKDTYVNMEVREVPTSK